MEGFEAINYVTKRIIRNHSNRRGNVCAQSMIKTVVTYINKRYDVAHELKKRSEEKNI